MKTIGIIPVKTQSTRFPGKNFSEFNEKTLLTNTIEKMLHHVDTIIISTDDTDKVKNIIDCFIPSMQPSIFTEPNGIKELKKGIYILHRNKELCTPETPTDDVICNIIINKLGFIKEDYTIALCQVTSPNWESRVLGYALERHESFNYEKTIISVSPDYRPNGCFYIFTKNKFMEYQHIYAPDLYLVVLDWKQCADIDYRHDLYIAEAVSKGEYDD